jgi:uncharacterized YigZ family protein
MLLHMAKDRYSIPAATSRCETQVSNSRFVASAAYTPTVEEAREFILMVRADMPDASHHCYAYLVGHGASVIAGMSDAGEPSGTAGRPMLAVLQGSGLGDVTVVVTRYFGGTLLGTGGLVRAYSDATRAILAELPRRERRERRSLLVRVAYSDYELAHRTLLAHNAEITNEDFAGEVSINAELPLSDLDDCRAVLLELSAGRVTIREI